MNSRPADKRGVAENFSSAAAAYESAAIAQSAIAANLVRRLPERGGIERIADLGCGTGVLAKLLFERYPAAAYSGLDMAPGMIAICRTSFSGCGKADFRICDIEERDAVIPGCSLVICSCAVQWLHRPVETLAMWTGSLRPGGILACALLAEGSFCELADAYEKAAGRSFQGVRLWQAADSDSLLKAADLKVINCGGMKSGESVVVQYSSAREALRSFKEIGALLPRNAGEGQLALSSTRKMLRHYGCRQDMSGGDSGQSREGGSATVTYRVHYLIAERKP